MFPLLTLIKKLPSGKEENFFEGVMSQNWVISQNWVVVGKSQVGIKNCMSSWTIWKGVIKTFAKFTGKHLCQSLFFNKVAGLKPKACNFFKKETLAHVFSCKFCKVFKEQLLIWNWYLSFQCPFSRKTQKINHGHNLIGWKVLWPWGLQLY